MANSELLLAKVKHQKQNMHIYIHKGRVGRSMDAHAGMDTHEVKKHLAHQQQR